VGGVDRCDIIVGPGNKWVTAAKSLVSGICAIGEHPRARVRRRPYRKYDIAPEFRISRSLVNNAVPEERTPGLHTRSSYLLMLKARDVVLMLPLPWADMLAGPSEVLVIADDTGDARTIASDLLAQV
jgi:hypothetical protein